MFALHPTLDALSTFMYVKDRDLRIVSANRAFCEALGVTREDLIGKPSDPLLGDEGPASARVDREVIQSGAPRLGIVEKYMASDGLRWVLTDKVPIKDADGTTIGLVGTSTDITKRKKAEDEVQRSESRLRFLSENMADVIWTMDMEFRTTYISPSVERVLGFTPEEWMRLRFDQMSTAESVEREYAALQRELAIETSGSADPDRTLTVDVEMYCKDGSTVWMEMVIRAIRDDTGNLVGMLGVSRDITERKRATEALQESEQKYRDLFEQSVDAINLTSPDGRILEANPAWFALFGQTADDLDCFNASNAYVEPEGRARFLETIARQDRIEDELQFKRKDGTAFDCHRVVTVQRRPDGSILGFQSVFHDVTETKKAELALRESEEKYRSLFEMSRDAIYLVRPDGVFIYVNQAWLDLLGCTRDDVSKYDAAHWYADPDERARYLERMARAGTRLDDEVKLKRKDGTVFDCQRRIVAQQDKDGNTIAFHGVMRDITEEKRAEQALRESEQKYRQLFDQSVAPISLLSPDGRIIEANDAWFNLFGYSRQDIPTFHTADIYPSPELREESVRRLLASGALLDDEARVKTRDGAYLNVLRSMVVRHNPDGSVLGYQTVWRDVTELTRARDELFASREQLRRLALRIQEAREEERTAIARELHDHFSQELTALRLDMDSLARSMPPSHDKRSTRVGRIIDLVDRMCRGVRGVISEMRPGMLDDLGLCAAVEWQAGQFSERTGIACTLTLAADDSGISPELSTSLFRVLQELLSNVAKHSGATSATVSLSSTGEAVYLTVTDNGRGITAAQLNSPSSLGILGIRERLLAHGGTLEIKGRPETGTTVTAAVPIRPST